MLMWMNVGISLIYRELHWKVYVTVSRKLGFAAVFTRANYKMLETGSMEMNS